MGFSHYWTIKGKITAKEFKDFSNKIKTLISSPEGKRLLAWEYDQPNTKPEVSDTLIRFNGKGENGHETFFFPLDIKNTDDHKGFSFCKTAQNPYDKYVVASLVIAKHVFGDKIDISSDGDEYDWAEGRALAMKVMELPGGRKTCDFALVTFPLTPECVMIVR